MRTLDEVIKAFEYTYENDPVAWTYGIDALHYLKEFKELSKMWNDRLDKENSNSALTWDELKQMEGMPVWVEEKGMLSIWIIIRDVTENWLYSTDCNAYRHEEYGKIWQAYLKEREHETA